MGQRILLVDDDEGFRYACARMISAAGFEVAEARDHRKALEILDDKRRIDLLIVDLIMPGGINGFALARMATMRHFDLRVLYVTGYDDVPLHEAVGKVLRKPIDDEQLLAEIKIALTSASIAPPPSGH
jgi:CheY-like chemotaxis protein